MDKKDIEFFISAAKCGSLAEAARKLYISRQAVSKRIAALELELGCQLFTRNSGGLNLTSAGARYIQLFSTFLSQLDELSISVKAVSPEQMDVTLVGFASNLEPSQLLESIMGSKDAVTQNLGVVSAYPDDLFDMLDKDELNMVVGPYKDRLGPSKYGSLMLMDTPLYLVRHRDYPVSSSQARDYTGCKLVLIDWSIEQQRRNNEKLNNTIFDRELINAWKQLGGDIRNTSAAANPTALKLALRLHQGVTLCSGMDMLLEDRDLVAVPLGIGSSLYCVWNCDSQTQKGQILAYKAAEAVGEHIGV